MKLSPLGEPLGLTYRQLKARQTRKTVILVLLLIAGVLYVTYGDTIALQAGLLH